MSDMFTQFTSLFQEDGVTLKDEGFVQSFREFSAFMVTWGNMVHRKLMNERESYHVANVSKGGWATEKSKFLLRSFELKCNETVS